MESNPKIRDNMGDYYQDRRGTLYFMVIQRWFNDDFSEIYKNKFCSKNTYLHF
jgi:hypothetical protein